MKVKELNVTTQISASLIRSPKTQPLESNARMNVTLDKTLEIGCA